LFRPGDGNEKAPRKAFTFKNFGEEIASTDYSIVYQIAGSAISQVLIKSLSANKTCFLWLSFHDVIIVPSGYVGVINLVASLVLFPVVVYIDPNGSAFGNADPDPSEQNCHTKYKEVKKFM
jgi:hypothetical protein